MPSTAFMGVPDFMVHIGLRVRFGHIGLLTLFGGLQGLSLVCSVTSAQAHQAQCCHGGLLW
jgi:hypothetical protein